MTPRRRNLRLPVIVAALACMAHGGEGCGHDDAKTASTLGPLTQAVCPPQQTLTYANFGRSFLTTYCLRCHSSSVQGAARMSAPSDHNFDTLIEIRGLAMHIDQKAGSGPVATNTSMPTIDPRPTLEARKKLSEWLACGAPE